MSKNEQLDKTLQETRQLLGNLKETLESKGLNVTKYQKMLKIARKNFIIFVKKYWPLLILGFGSIFMFIFYFVSVYNRVPRCLHKLDPLLEGRYITPIANCPRFRKGNFILADFYVASSYRSFLPCSLYYDYSSIDMIVKALTMGARYIELDVYNKNFCEITVPVVCSGKELGNWHWTTDLDFDDCCKAIVSTAFSGQLTNASDPLFLKLNIFTEGNCNTQKAIAKILLDNFQNFLLDIPKYGYSKYPIGSIPVMELLWKVIIITNGDFEDTPSLNEIINISTMSTHFARQYTDIAIEDLHDHKELVNYTRSGQLVTIFPSTLQREVSNYNPQLSWLLGCNFVCMYYNTNDDNLKRYIKKFNKTSFVLKPCKLRYKQLKIKQPAPQSSVVSFAPRQTNIPGQNFMV